MVFLVAGDLAGLGFGKPVEVRGEPDGKCFGFSGIEGGGEVGDGAGDFGEVDGVGHEHTAPLAGVGDELGRRKLRIDAGFGG